MILKKMNKLTEKQRKLPLGVQNFEGLINDGYIYIDKTEYLYKLVHTGKQFFLSRPRRFGKSLFLSTLEAYWEGKKELFKGLIIERLEGSVSDSSDLDREGFVIQDSDIPDLNKMDSDIPDLNSLDSWQPHPVFYFDFNRTGFEAEDALETIIDAHLKEWEEVYGRGYNTESLSIRFQQLLKQAYIKTGKRCVVLVDEYDKPLLEVMDNNEQAEHNKDVFKGFFGTLKSYDKYVRFVFITGVTKFSKVSIFSDLNHLTDISLNENFSGICGITESELIGNFEPEIKKLMLKQGIDKEECLKVLKKTYDGYHFSKRGEGVYNPYSLFTSFWNEDIGAYWFETGTPTFLVKKLRELNYDVKQFSNESLFVTEKRISDFRTTDKIVNKAEDNYRNNNEDIIPLLYQTGYLTIEGYDAKKRFYTLGFPNEEVKYAFLDSLIPEYAPAVYTESGKDIISIWKYLDDGDLNSLRNALTALYASITYTTNDSLYEHYFQIVIYLVFELLNQYVHSEVHSALGRADCIVETDKYVYIFEFKKDDSADSALKQIEAKGYGKPYVADKRILYMIGVNFDTETKNISEWKVEKKG